MWGVNDATITSALGRMKLRIPKEIALDFRKRGREKALAKIIHPADKIIKQHYLDTNVNQLAKMIGRSETYIKGRISKLGLIIPPEIIKQRKIDSRIKPGNVPMNKGKKQIEYMSPEAIERTRATRFRKGNIPHNRRKYKDGDISIRYDRLKNGNYRPYKWIRISLKNWKMLHVHNWEKMFGPIPEGYIVVFKDKDSMNCEPENLELITLAENMERNTIHRYPGELKKIVRVISRISKSIKSKQHG